MQKYMYYYKGVPLSKIFPRNGKTESSYSFCRNLIKNKGVPIEKAVFMTINRKPRYGVQKQDDLNPYTKDETEREEQINRFLLRRLAELEQKYQKKFKKPYKKSSIDFFKLSVKLQNVFIATRNGALLMELKKK